jgi:hypothetical protein
MHIDVNEWQNGRDRLQLEGASKFSWSASTAAAHGGPAERHFLILNKNLKLWDISQNYLAKKTK